MVVQWMRSNMLAPITLYRAPDQRSVMVDRTNKAQADETSLVSRSAIPGRLSSDSDNVRS